MVVLLVVLTIALFLVAEWLFATENEGAELTAGETGQAAWPPHLSEPGRVAGFLVQEEMAFHPGHAWAYAEGPARVRVGMDDFARRLVGKVDRIDMPEVGTRVVQGQPAWVLHHGGRKAAILSPVTGEVVAVNPRVREEAGSVTSAPYTDGWLLSVRADDLRTNLNNLLRADMVRHWIESVSARLRMQMSPGLALTVPDGGPAVEDICSLVDDAQWRQMVREYFLNES